MQKQIIHTGKKLIPNAQLMPHKIYLHRRYSQEHRKSQTSDAMIFTDKTLF